MSLLRHEHLIPFYGAVTTNGMMIVTKYVKGGSLHSYLHNSENTWIPYPTYLRFALEIAKGMVQKFP
jgi:serine/threonine protein kinase